MLNIINVITHLKVLMSHALMTPLSSALRTMDEFSIHWIAVTIELCPINLDTRLWSKYLESIANTEIVFS